MGMRKIFLLLGIIFCVLGCGNEQSEVDVAEVEHDSIWQYVGSTFVQFQDSVYETQDIRIEFILTGDSTVAFNFYKVKFVPQMPVTIDFSLSDVSCVNTPAGYTLQGDSIVPTIGDNPVEKYLATNLIGFCNSDSIHLTLHFGSYPTTYIGRREQ